TRCRSHGRRLPACALRRRQERASSPLHRGDPQARPRPRSAAFAAEHLPLCHSRVRAWRELLRPRGKTMTIDETIQKIIDLKLHALAKAVRKMLELPP